MTTSPETLAALKRARQLSAELEEVLATLPVPRLTRIVADLEAFVAIVADSETFDEALDRAAGQVAAREGLWL